MAGQEHLVQDAIAILRDWLDTARTYPADCMDGDTQKEQRDLIKTVAVAVIAVKIGEAKITANAEPDAGPADNS